MAALCSSSGSISLLVQSVTVVLMLVAVCEVNSFQISGNTNLLQPRQGLAPGTSPTLQPLLTQFLQGQNSPVFPGQHQGLTNPGFGLESQGLPFSPLRNTIGGQGLATPLHTLQNRGLLGAAPFPLRAGLGLGGTQLFANPALLGMLPGVNRLGGFNGLGGANHLGIPPGALTLNPLLTQTPTRQENLGQLLRLASLLSDNPGIRDNTPSTPNPSIQDTDSFRHRPQHPHPFHRLLSLPINVHDDPRTSRITPDRHIPLGFPRHRNLVNDVSSSQSAEFSSSPRPFLHTSLPSLMSSGTHRPTQLDTFRFPTK